MTWRVLVTDGLSEEGLRLLQDQAEVIESETLEALGESDALVVRGRTKVTADVLDQAGPRLKVIGRAGVGVDNIDLQAAQSKEIIVVNSPEAVTVAVAELTLGLMLSLARRIPFADAGLRRIEWRKPELKGTELSEKVLGIIGMGRIGAAVAARARALGMEVLGNDAYLSNDELRQRGAVPTEFDTLLGNADYICLHMPLTDETRGLIGSAAIGKMKQGACLISSATGGAGIGSLGGGGAGCIFRRTTRRFAAAPASKYDIDASYRGSNSRSTSKSRAGYRHRGPGRAE
jgi:D-3-phosphoglycerate dehydrogenase